MTNEDRDEMLEYIAEAEISPDGRRIIERALRG
jgi:hypothetical protein